MKQTATLTKSMAFLYWSGMERRLKSTKGGRESEAPSSLNRLKLKQYLQLKNTRSNVMVKASDRMRILQRESDVAMPAGCSDSGSLISFRLDGLTTAKFEV